jgi:type IV pilus assembly protein PilC
MSVFTYIAITSMGHRIKAVASASSLLDLEQSLVSQGMAVLDVREGGRLGEASHSVVSSGPGGPRPSKVSRRDLVEFCIFIGTQLEAGVSLHSSLIGFAEEIHHPWFKFVVQEIVHRVEGGASLSDGMRLFPQVFNTEFHQLIRAGERTGTLARAFHDLRVHLEWVDDLMGNVRQATTYPLVVGSALFLFVLYLFAFVIPKISRVLSDMHLDLPVITRVVFGIGSFVAHSWFIWIGLFLILPIVVRIWVRRSEKFSYWLDKQKIAVPFVGHLLSLILQSRFTHNFSVMHRAGISILENLELSAELMGNRVFRKAILDARKSVREGNRLTESLRASGVFSGLVVQMLYVGESAGILEKSLQYAADYYDKEVPRALKVVFSIFEPLMILSLVLIVGCVALAIFLPIISISGGIR